MDAIGVPRLTGLAAVSTAKTANDEHLANLKRYNKGPTRDSRSAARVVFFYKQVCARELLRCNDLYGTQLKRDVYFILR
ncbi:hypothetical protein [Paenibacillus sp. XY044]|uniref:hypothetical protein n=1 Tax=Paenibacillus sp. XY044 TaxID=2026089 RepID=UPI00117BE2BF|nr:hypothetical protein [Paenibacillus sp. XY044]